MTIDTGRRARRTVSVRFEIFCIVLEFLEAANVRAHRADQMKVATGSAASEAPGGPRCYASWALSGRRTLALEIGERSRKDEIR